MSSDYQEVPDKIPTLYPEVITVNRLVILGMVGTEAAVSFVLSGPMEMYSGQPRDEWPRGTIMVAVAPNVAEAMIPMMMRCVAWREGQEVPGGTLVLEWNNEMLGDGDEGEVQRNAGPGSRGREGSGEGSPADDHPEDPRGGVESGGDGPGLASGDVGGHAREEVAPVPPEVELGICMHTVDQVVNRVNDSGIPKAYCIGCNTYIED